MTRSTISRRALLLCALVVRCHGLSAPRAVSIGLPVPSLGFSASYNLKRCRSSHSCNSPNVRSRTVLRGGQTPPDADGTPRSPLLDAFRVKLHSEWARQNRGETSSGQQLLSKAYIVAGFATISSWSACAVVSLSAHPDAALDAICGLRHNVLTISQALAFPVPLVFAVVAALRSAANVGWSRLHSVTYRRLNLGLAACSLWMGASAAFMPAFACGYQMYSSVLRACAAAAHLFTAIVCLAAWGRTVDGKPGGRNYIARLVRGVVGSVMSFPPKQVSDDPDTAQGSDGRNEYALCSLLFVWFAAMPVISPFPLATIPSILGRRLSRAASGWTFLAAVVCYALKDGAERGRLNASTFKTLRHGLAFGSAAHLCVLALKLCGVDGGGLLIPGRGLWEFYPMAMSVPFAASTSCLMYALAIFTSWRPSTSETEPPIGVFE